MCLQPPGKWPQAHVFHESVARTVATQAVEVPTSEPKVEQKERARRWRIASALAPGSQGDVESRAVNEAAARLQALHRGRKSRRLFVRTVRAATKVQALHRGRSARKLFQIRMRGQQAILRMRLGGMFEPMGMAPAAALHSPRATPVPEVRAVAEALVVLSGVGECEGSS